MLEDTLAQVFATVLVGILVFLTIERRFESLDEKGIHTGDGGIEQERTSKMRRTN